VFKGVAVHKRCRSLS